MKHAGNPGLWPAANRLCLGIAFAALAAGLLHWHGGWPGWSNPGTARIAWAVAGVLAYAVLCVATWRARARPVHGDIAGQGANGILNA